MSKLFAACPLHRAVFAGLFAALFLALSFRPLLAQDQLIRAHLAAGEFAPAVAAAEGMADPQERDGWLERIAAAQAQAGVRDAALRTAGNIYDDRTRADALSNINSVPIGGLGGGSQADFDPLLDLIQSTIAPQTWEGVGGPGAVAPFPTGVYVDAVGTLRPAMKHATGGTLASLYTAGKTIGQSANARKASPLRMVSLPRLEKYLQLRLAAGKQPDEAMQTLAGLQRIKYVFVYPETGDLVLAGPAGDWQHDDEGRIVSADTNLPVMRLDDLAVLLRYMTTVEDCRFGCNITPRKESLARTKAFLEESAKKPLAAGAAARKAWLKKLRAAMGVQDIGFNGVDPRTRVAHVMIEADYRMKLVGMGIEEGVAGVQSYLDSMQLAPGEAPPPMGVLRWWFTLNYDAITTTKDFRAFEIRGQGVKVLSENELITAKGERVHTGKSEELNRKFAQSFTKHFDSLCDKYHVYAELRNVFDLALACALIREERLAEKVDWHMTCLGSGGEYQVQLGPAPKEVDTVINHRLIRPGQFIAGVSGGVDVYCPEVVNRRAMKLDERGYLDERRTTSEAADMHGEVWWWD